MQPSPVERVAAEQAAYTKALEQRIFQRADGTAHDVIHALECWVRLAADLKDPRRAAAQAQLRQLTEVLEAARAVASGLQIVKHLPGGGNGGDQRA